MTLLRFCLLLLFSYVTAGVHAQIITITDGDYSNNGTWFGTAPDESFQDVLIMHNVNLDVSLNIGANFEVQGSLTGTSGNDINVDGVGDLTVGAVNIDGDMSFSNDAVLTVKSGDTLTVNNIAFQNNAIATIESGGVIIVNNDFEAKNNTVITLDGEIWVGNSTTVRNNTIIQGNGAFKAGSSTTIKNGATIFGSTTECTDCVYSSGCTMSTVSTNWLGSSSDWFDPANWSDGLPDNVTPATISSSAPNMPIITVAGAETFHLTVEADAALTISGTNSIDVYGNLTLDGSLIQNQSNVRFVGDCWSPRINAASAVTFYDLEINNPNDVSVVGAQCNIEGSMDVLGGALYTNDSITIISNTSGTGRIGEILGSGVIGEIVMERYIDAGETNWRYFGSAVANPQIEQYNDDFITSGYTGSHYPTFPFVSVYTYDETMGAGLGYLECTGSTQTIDVGQGLQVWCGDTITGTLPFTVDLRGVPNQGDINLPVTFTNTGTPSEDGYCMVGNPYPSTIDWDAAGWTKTNMDNAVYIQDPDTELYATYIDGASTNGGSRYIASQQSFWVKANAASPVLTITESCKATNDATFFRSGESSDPGANISLTGFGKTDECVIRHREGMTQDFEGSCDAEKLWGGWGVQPQVSLLNPDEKDFSVHTFDFGHEEWAVPLRVVVFETGTYYIEFENIEELNVPCLVLEDTYDGSTYAIEEGIGIPFEISDTTYAPRFVLHIGKNYASTVTDNLCYGDENGSIELDLDSSLMDFDVINGAETTSYSESADPIALLGLEAGNYTINVPGLNTLCEDSSFTFFVGEPSKIVDNEEITHFSEASGGSIEVEILGGTAPYTYLWNTGDDTPLILDLEPGIYTLDVTDSNGCEFSNTYEVISVVGVNDNKEELIEVYHNRTTDEVFIRNWPDISSELNLVGINGQLIHVFKPNSGAKNFSVQLPASLASGIYVLSSPNINFGYKISVSK